MCSWLHGGTEAVKGIEGQWSTGGLFVWFFVIVGRVWVMGAGDEGSLKRVGGVVRWLFMFIFLLSSDLWLLWTWLRIRNHLGFGTLEQCAPSVCIIVVRAGGERDWGGEQEQAWHCVQFVAQHNFWNIYFNHMKWHAPTQVVSFCTPNLLMLSLFLCFSSCRSIISECLASFLYVFIVCGAAAGAGVGASVSSVLLATALASGLAMATLTQCFLHISGKAKTKTNVQDLV